MKKVWLPCDVTAADYLRQRGDEADCQAGVGKSAVTWVPELDVLRDNPGNTADAARTVVRDEALVPEIRRG